LRFRSSNAIWFYHEWMFVQVIHSSYSRIFLNAWVFVTDLFHHLSWTKIFKYFWWRSNIWTVYWFLIRKFPSRVIFKKLLSKTSDKSTLIHPFIFGYVPPSFGVLSVLTRGDSDFAKFLTLFYSLSLTSYPFPEFKVSFLFFTDYSRSLQRVSLNKFSLISNIEPSVVFLCILSSNLIGHML
jgi:hypothetical protein